MNFLPLNSLAKWLFVSIFLWMGPYFTLVALASDCSSDIETMALLKSFQTKGNYLDNTISSCAVMLPNSQVARKVILFTVPDKDTNRVKNLAIKVFDNRENFMKEWESLKADDPLLKPYIDCVNDEMECIKPVPMIIQKFGAVALNKGELTESGAILFTQALGDSLFDILHNFKFQGNSKNYDVQEIFFYMGQQMGDIDALYCKVNLREQGACLRLAHPDSQQRNIFYRVGHKEMSWIDLAGLSFTKIDERNPLPISQGTGKRGGYQFLEAEYTTICSRIASLAKVEPSSVAGTERIKNLTAEILPIMNAINAFFDGYRIALENNGLRDLAAQVANQQEKYIHKGILEAKPPCVKIDGISDEYTLEEQDRIKRGVAIIRKNLS